MEAVAQQKVVMSVRACILKPGSKDVTTILADTNYPDEDVFDVMTDYLDVHGVTENIDCVFNFVTEHIKGGKTLEVYVGWGNREIEPNKYMNKALRHFFDTNEAFDVYGPCVVFALFDDIPVDFDRADFNSLFFNL